MAIDASNQPQADFWTSAGALWTALRDRFDDQVNEHGLAAIDALNLEAGESVIDVGCGAGSTTVQVAERVGEDGRVRGLDISQTMIEGARAHAEAQGVATATFDVGDAMAETFDGDADAVFSRFGVMFFSDAVAGFANILTALRPGGRLGFVCWQSPVDNPWASQGFRAVGQFIEMPFRGGDPTAPGPFSLGERERLESVIVDSGFEDVSIEPRVTPVRMGDDAADAAGFFTQLTPAAANLAADDPEKAAELRAALIDLFSEWEGPDGVQAPSAVWIVTARRPSTSG